MAAADSVAGIEPDDDAAELPPEPAIAPELVAPPEPSRDDDTLPPEPAAEDVEEAFDVADDDKEEGAEEDGAAADDADDEDSGKEEEEEENEEEEEDGVEGAAIVEKGDVGDGGGVCWDGRCGVLGGVVVVELAADEDADAGEEEEAGVLEGAKEGAMWSWSCMKAMKSFTKLGGGDLKSWVK